MSLGHKTGHCTIFHTISLLIWIFNAFFPGQKKICAFYPSTYFSVCRSYFETEYCLPQVQRFSLSHPHNRPKKGSNDNMRLSSLSMAKTREHQTVTRLTASCVPWLLLLIVQTGPPYASTVYFDLRFSRSYSTISPLRPVLNRRCPAQQSASTVLPSFPGITCRWRLHVSSKTLHFLAIP